MKLNTRNSLLISAIELFKTYGFNKTSMEEIAKLAHKSKGTLYNHFSDKESIMLSVIEDEIKEIKSLLEPLLCATKNIEQFKQYMQTRMESISKYPLFCNTLLADNASSDYYFLKPIRDEFDKWEYNAIKNYIMAFQPKLIDADALAGMSCMILKSLEVQFFIAGKYKDFASTYDIMTNLLADGVAIKLENKKQ
ncbi:MAG: TetR/AcrR family transcriptional regulator [Paludibacteraceae bacterium]|nr:TetR/AcrR family transcriptional regulator [Paludibacteraceae bacterium]